MIDLISSSDFISIFPIFTDFYFPIGKNSNKFPIKFSDPIKKTVDNPIPSMKLNI